MDIQIDRNQIHLRVEDYVLDLVDELCKIEGFNRNKLIERFIREKIKEEYQKRNRIKELENLYKIEREKVLILEVKINEFEKNENKKKNKTKPIIRTD